MTIQRTLATLAVALGLLMFGNAANAEYAPKTHCAQAPSVAPVMLFPANGAIDVPLKGTWLELALPQAISAKPEDLRLVLTDTTPYANDGGTFQPDTSDYPVALLGTLPGLALGDSTTFVKTWMPPLRANTQYTVNLTMPNAGNCIYVALGSFTSGPLR